MKTPERFNRAINALVDSFFNDTLAKGNCAACAIGNIVAAGYNDKVIRKEGKKNTYHCKSPNNRWSSLFATADNIQDIDKSKLADECVLENIKVTGYLWEDLAKIEKAFENNTEIHNLNYEKYTKKEIMEDQYNGLVAAIDVLCRIEGLDSITYKDLFKFDEEFKPVNL
jgi:hypothetical protein